MVGFPCFEGRGPLHGRYNFCLHNSMSMQKIELALGAGAISCCDLIADRE